MKAYASAQLHLEGAELDLRVNRFNYKNDWMVSLSLGATEGSLDVFMTAGQFAELMDKLQTAQDEMTEAM